MKSKPRPQSWQDLNVKQGQALLSLFVAGPKTETRFNEVFGTVYGMSAQEIETMSSGDREALKAVIYKLEEYLCLTIDPSSKIIEANGTRYYIETNPANLPPISIAGIFKYLPTLHEAPNQLHYLAARMARPYKRRLWGKWKLQPHDPKEIDRYCEDMLKANFTEFYSVLSNAANHVGGIAEALFNADFDAAARYGIRPLEVPVAMENLFSVLDPNR